MKNILIVDDSTFQQRILTKHLTKAGYHVEIANNGREALAMINSLQPFVIVMDLIMPEMSGIEVLTQLQTMEVAPPVIVHTADIQSTTYDECIALGAFEVISKPTERDVLLGLVAQIEEAVG
jgi:CheY-like chemotaxis protein